MKHVSLSIVALGLALALVAPAAARDFDSRIGQPLVAALDDPDGASRQADGTWAVWVHFNDRNLAGAELDRALEAARERLSDRALARRAKMHAPGAALVGESDLPVAPAYLASVLATGAELRRESRWLNAVSVNATREQIDSLGALPFVAHLNLVARLVRPNLEVGTADAETARRVMDDAAEKSRDLWTLGYGGTTAALEQINVPPLHESGLNGDGVLIAMLDSGTKRTHAALQNVDVVAEWDFVNDDGVVENEPGDPDYQDRHGTHTLSSIMGFKDGDLIGPAFGASVILAKTEDISDETQIEEDNWIVAAEWVETLGADIISSSLGYYYWYEFSDLDGDTALITIAADLAVAHGMCVFTSAGNQRGDEDWPYLTTPADGDSVVAVAAVDYAGEIATFSSAGPTFDGRIKPDVSARGVNNFVVSYYDDEYYQVVDGTSFACPLVAGVAALLLERIPSLTPMEIRDALRETADRAGAPDNDYGWGIIDAVAAAAYWGPTITHTALTDSEDLVGPYVVTATISDRFALNPAGLFVYWRVDGGSWNQVPMSSIGGDEYQASIPGQPAGGLVEYYLEASDSLGITVQAPHGAPDASFAFTVGSDLIAPLLIHGGPTDQTPTTWPPTLWANATDNQAIDSVDLTFTVNDGPEQGPFAFSSVGDLYQLTFPLSTGDLTVGDVLFYEITASDVATVPNATISGPHEMRYVESVAQVLVIDDTSIHQPQSDNPRTIDAMVGWLDGAGYATTVVAPTTVDIAFLDQGWDVIVLTCANNLFPVTEPVMRAALIDWADSGGRILIEGGSIGEASFHDHDYADFNASVLHCDEWWGWGGGLITVAGGYETHHAVIRPNLLPPVIEQDTSEFPYDTGSGDVLVPSDDATLLYQSIYASEIGGVILYDDNTGPESGQIVYVTIDTGYLDEAVGRALIENSMAYLVAREAPGNASIAGTVSLADSEDASGTLVTCGDQSQVTGPSGAFLFAGLHGSTYTVRATLDGYSPAVRTVRIGPDEAVTDVTLELVPIIEVVEQANPEISIPDFDSDGITSTIDIAAEGFLTQIEVGINIGHPSIGNLTVTLTSPEGTEVTLHNRTGAIADDIVGTWPVDLNVDGPGSLHDFLGESVTGTWILHVADHQFGAAGTLHSWSLNLLVSPLDVLDAGDDLPATTRLVGNMPNPFNPQTKVRFDLKQGGHVSLEIFDLRGRLIRRLIDGSLSAGRHEVTWNGRSDAGREQASGVYLCRLITGETTERLKMSLVR